MVRGISIRIAVTESLIGPFLCAMISIGHAQSLPFVSPVTTTVFDESGALIPNCEIVFKGDSGTVVSRTEADGSVTLNLQSGRYSVTTIRSGFVRTEIRDVQVPTSEALHVVMKVAPTPINDGPIGDVFLVTTTRSELPNVIVPEVTHVPTGLLAPKTRSWRCLYLWKCTS